MMKESQNGYDLLVRGGIAAAGCSFVRIGNMGGENYCGNQVISYRSREILVL